MDESFWNRPESNRQQLARKLVNLLAMLVIVFLLHAARSQAREKLTYEEVASMSQFQRISHDATA